jgi:hypothetical protein
MLSGGRSIAGITEVSSLLACAEASRLACCSSALTVAAASLPLIERRRLARIRALTPRSMAYSTSMAPAHTAMTRPVT